MIAVSKATSEIEWIIRQMHNEASRRNAPVFSAGFKDPFKILVFTFLSARTRDSTTIKAAEKLFSVADSPEKIAMLQLKKVEALLYGVGFYHVKSRNLLAISKAIAKSGKVPDDFPGLTALPGVGRKTANIVLSRAFGKNTLGVDVHVHRISNRIGLVKTKKPEETETALMKIVSGNSVSELNRNFVAFGQTICLPRNPKCSECPINRICRRVNVGTTCKNCRY